MTHIKNILILVFCTTIFFSNAQEIQETNEFRYQGINIGNETRVFRSKINGKAYKLYVNLPLSYKENVPNSYPTLYVLDAQWDFTSVVSAQDFISYDKLSPELIIIGVSYAGENPDYESLRTNDMTPTKLPMIKNSGNSKSFTEVLRKEIIPFVEKEYKASNTNRTLAGNSFGGLYAHYVLFNDTDLFHNYIICNPSYWYDNELPFTIEKDYYKNNKTLNANVFLVSGSFDDIERHNKMTKQIDSRNYKGLNFKSYIAEGLGHSSAKPEGFAKGILYSYKRRGVKINEKNLLKYIGDYEFAPGQKIAIIIYEEHLAIKELYGQVNIPIYTLANNKFSIEGTYKVFNFNKNDKGEVISLTTEYNNNLITLMKVK